MAGFNLPPGTSISDIPGNRPEDEEWEQFENWALNKLSTSGYSTLECRAAILLGLEAVRKIKGNGKYEGGYMNDNCKQVVE